MRHNVFSLGYYFDLIEIEFCLKDILIPWTIHDFRTEIPLIPMKRTGNQAFTVCLELDEK